MTLSECLERLAVSLWGAEIPFAVAGGLAAGLYRAEPRLTGDVDFIVAVGSDDLETPEGLLRELGFTPGRVRRADFDGGPLFAIKNKSTPLVMLVGRDSETPDGVGADLLLTAVPWVETALARAREHQVDFGFGKVPVLTLEDVILSKLYALGKAVNRPKDLDDIQSIYETDPQPDLIYLQARIDELGIRLSSQKKSFLPPELRPMV